MAAVATYPSLCSGHAGFPPRLSAGTTNSTVFVEGKPVHVVGDPWGIHVSGENAHAGFVVSGSANVFVGPQRLPMARIGDGIAGGCASLIAKGAATVYCGG